MNEMQVFENTEFGAVRTTIIDGEPWFVGKDVAVSLGYTNPLKAIRDHVDKEDKRGERFVHPQGGTQETVIINESGLYSLILSSKLPTAKKFKRWVTSEVLPTIRKHGVYATDELLDNPDFLIETLQALKSERTRTKELETTVAVQKQQLAELQPKASYYDIILNNKSLVTITQIAKDYGMSGKAMNKQLADLKVQYKQSRQWLLYSKYQSFGYTHSQTFDIEQTDGQTRVVAETKWTQKGRLFIYELLKLKGILPVIERE